MSTDYLIPPERYETPEFVLRAYIPGDGKLINDAVNTSQDHLRPWMPWATGAEVPVIDHEKLVRMWRGDWLQSKEFMIGIFAPGEHRLLGSTGFMLRGARYSPEKAEIGMWIRASEAGKGLGTRALIALMTWGFSEWPWERLYWKCDSRNIGSYRTAEKAGLKREAHLRRDFTTHLGEKADLLIYAALRDEWRAPDGK